jgi:hypothetical protein
MFGSSNKSPDPAISARRAIQTQAARRRSPPAGFPTISANADQFVSAAFENLSNRPAMSLRIVASLEKCSVTLVTRFSSSVAVFVGLEALDLGDEPVAQVLYLCDEIGGAAVF